MRGAERDQHAGVAPAIEALEEVARDEAAHRVPDEHELGIGVALSLRMQLLIGERAQPSRRHPVVAAPVVRELDVRLPRHHVEAIADQAGDRGVPVDPPQSRDDVDVGHHPGGRDSVPEIVLLPRVLLEGQRAHAAPERPQCPTDRSRRWRPDLLAVTRQRAAEDSWQQHDHVAHRFLGHGTLPLLADCPLYQARRCSIISFGNGHLRLRRVPGDVHTAGRGTLRSARRRCRGDRDDGRVRAPPLRVRVGAGRARGRRRQGAAPYSAGDLRATIDSGDAGDPRRRG